MSQAKVIEVIQAKFVRGKGDDKSCLVREVVQYFTLSGDLIVEKDPAPCECEHHEQIPTV